MTSPSLALRARRLLAVALTGVVVSGVALLGGASAAGAAATPPLTGSSATGPPASLPVEIAVAVGSNGVLDRTAPLTITVATANPNDMTTAVGPVTIGLVPEPLTTAEEIAAWHVEPVAQPGEVLLTTIDVPALAAHGSASTTGVVDATALQTLAAGVYGIRAAAGALAAAGLLVVPGAAATGTLGVIVPITGPPSESATWSAARLEQLTAPGGALHAQLNAVTGTSAILAIDPAIPASIRLLGDQAPATATAWLRELLALPNTRFALSYGDADLAAQFGAGLGRPLTAPSPSSEWDADALVDIGLATPAVLWPATGTASADFLAEWGTDEIDDVVPTTLVAGSGGVRTASEGTLVYDAAISAALRTAADSADPVARAGALATAAALASFVPAESPLLVTLDRPGVTGEPGRTRSAAALNATLSSALRLGDRPVVGLDALRAAAPGEATPLLGEADAARVARVSTLTAREGELRNFATILEDPSVLIAPERAEILNLIGNAWTPYPAEAQLALDRHEADTRATLNAVQIARPSGITLLASNAALAFSVRNDLPWPVSVVMVARPGDPRLIVQTTTIVDVGASQTARVQVPVEARVGSGESTLTLQLRSPSMIAVSDPVPVAIAVRAEWESVGIIVMAVLVGGLLVLGVVRTVRKIRSRTTEDADG